VPGLKRSSLARARNAASAESARGLTWTRPAIYLELCPPTKAAYVRRPHLANVVWIRAEPFLRSSAPRVPNEAHTSGPDGVGAVRAGRRLSATGRSPGDDSRPPDRIVCGTSRA